MGYTKKIDVYSLGCVAYELATYQPPFYEHKTALSRLNAMMNNEPIPIDSEKWSEDF